MSKNLVIVESPAKAKTIEKYLGKDFTVLSSIGHIRSIPKKTKDGTPPIDIKNGFKTQYEIDPEKCIDCGVCADTCPVGAPAQD